MTPTVTIRQYPSTYSGAMGGNVTQPCQKNGATNSDGTRQRRNMEISQKATEPKFEPVTIRLDTVTEVAELRHVLYWSKGNADMQMKLLDGLAIYTTTMQPKR